MFKVNNKNKANLLFMLEHFLTCKMQYGQQLYTEVNLVKSSVIKLYATPNKFPINCECCRK